VRVNRRGPARLALRGPASDWLSKSLTYELAWIRANLSDSDLRELRRAYLEFDSFMTARSIASYCHSVSIDNLVRLVDLVVTKIPNILDGMYKGDDPSHTDASKPMDALKEFDQSLAEDEIRDVDLFRRLSWQDAKNAIHDLKELQVVIEGILGKGWENRDQAWRDWDKHNRPPYGEEHEPDLGDPKEGPDQRIPVWSIKKQWAQKHGLEKSADPRFAKSWILSRTGAKVSD